MYNRNQTVRSLGIISAIVLLAISPAQAADLTVRNLTVTGNTVMRKDAQIEGNIGVGLGAIHPAANMQIHQTGSGVGIFLGNRAPFGQALFETDLTAPATHAWFAENGTRVFSVTGGGAGFFSGPLEVGDTAFISGEVFMGSDANVNGNFSVGDPIAGSTSLVQIYGERIFPAFAPSRFTILPNGNVGVGIFDPTAKLHVAGNVHITGPRATLRVEGFGLIAASVSSGPLVASEVINTGDETITGNQSFGQQTRQMINLWKTDYGIGVQDFAFYQRTGNEFFWYKGGVHSNTFGDPGGGTQLMRLGKTGALLVSGSVVTPVLQITGGSDVAEPFKMSRDDVPKGAVVVIDEENAGELKLSEGAYDRRVAGVVSGANGITPGISLSQQGVVEGGQNVALSGRVYVLADASTSPIKPGDLLTTSDTPGRAMKVTDHARAQGAVIGKAMSALKEGQGIVLVLVTLQ